MSFNKITIVGNLGRDPELRYTPAGQAICTLAIATNTKRGEETITTWFRVKVWGKQGETASKYLTKGKPVYIEGRLVLEEWTDKEGKQRFTLEVSASDMQFIHSNDGERDDNTVGMRREETSKSVPVAPFDDMPF